MTKAPTVAIIPAFSRGEDAPDDPLTQLCGRSLLDRALDALADASIADHSVVVTDKPEIADAASALGAQSLSAPATDTTAPEQIRDVTLKALAQLDLDPNADPVVVYLPPQAPLRTSADIRSCTQMVEAGPYDCVATFAPAKVHPTWVYRIKNGIATQLIERPPEVWRPGGASDTAYELTHAVYAFRASKIAEQEPAAMPFGRRGAVVIERARAIFIRSSLDALQAEILLSDAAAEPV